MRKHLWIVLLLIAFLLICVSLAIWPAAGTEEEAVRDTEAAARAVVESIAMDRAEEARRLEELMEEKERREAVSTSSTASGPPSPQGEGSDGFAWIDGPWLKFHGTVWYDGWKWTWYSQRVLPGGGLDIPGRHVDADGFVCDADGYICLASTNAEDKRTGAVYMTPFGRYGKVYDFCDGVDNPTLDVYVVW